MLLASRYNLDSGPTHMHLSVHCEQCSMAANAILCPVACCVSYAMLMLKYVDRRQAWAGLFMAGGLRSASYLFQKVRKAYHSH